MRRHLKQQGRKTSHIRSTAEGGYSLLELSIVVAVILIMAIMSTPVIQSTMAFYDLQAAVSAVSGSIQSTRYRAISNGYPYKITFDKSTNKYQVTSCPQWVPTDPNNCNFTEQDSAVSFTNGGSSVKLEADFAIQFFPSGSVLFVSGSNPIELSRQIGSKSDQTRTKSITVSNYGSVKVQ